MIVYARGVQRACCCAGFYHSLWSVHSTARHGGFAFWYFCFFLGHIFLSFYVCVASAFTFLFRATYFTICGVCIVCGDVWMCVAVRKRCMWCEGLGWGCFLGVGVKDVCVFWVAILYNVRE